MSALTVTRTPDGQPVTEAAPEVGDLLIPELGRQVLTVDYIVTTHQVADVRYTVCGVSYPCPVDAEHPAGLAGTTITVRTPA